MIQCRFRGMPGTYKARSTAGQWVGSHSTFQRVLERSVRSVLKTKRTYGFCTAQAAPTTTRPSPRAVLRPGAPARGHPLPPPGPGLVGGDYPQFFPPFSWISGNPYFQQPMSVIADNQPKGVFDGL